MKRKFVLFLFAVLLYVMNLYGQWNPVPGLPRMEFSTVHIYGDTLYASSANFIYKSGNGGNSWTPTNIISNDVDFISAILKINNRLLVGTYNYGIFESNDGGNSWAPVNNGLAGNGSKSIIAMAERGDSVYAGTDGSSIFVMSKNGNSWSPFNLNIPMNISGAVYSLYNFNGRLLSGSGANAQVYLNEYGQTGWQEVQFGVFDPLGTSMLELINKNDILYGIGSQGIHKSTDAGIKWEYYNPGVGLISNGNFFLYNQMVYAMLAKAGSSYYFYHNNNWQFIESQNGVLTYRFVIANDKIFAARLDGLFYRQLSTTAVDGKNSSLPEKFMLHQNYPNPFNPATTIRYALPYSSRVSITIYNLLGRQIKSLLDAEKPAGQHEVNFHAGDLASGIYFYKINAVALNNEKSFSETKKLVLLK